MAGCYEIGYPFSRVIKCAQFLTTSSFSRRTLPHIMLPTLVRFFLRTEAESNEEVLTAVTTKNTVV